MPLASLAFGARDAPDARDARGTVCTAWPRLGFVGMGGSAPHPNEPPSHRAPTPLDKAMGKGREHQGGKLLPPPCLLNYTPFFAKTIKANFNETELEPTNAILRKGRSILNNYTGNRKFDRSFCSGSYQFKSQISLLVVYKFPVLLKTVWI